ncbi:MAG TPA: ABC transporter ATP-binding protein [Longimicrobiaceae bacterium]|nr:ABC transporter ATP-binding protein [Longimicrobiaceae bacterium]
MADIRLEHVDKVYPNGYVAARELSLEVADGELLVLVGPSGSGKSTVLRMIAGLEAPTGGTVWIGGRDVTRLPPQERDLAMVFQSYALYPHMTVRENLGFGLRMRKVAAEEIRRRVDAVAESLGLAELLDRRPAQLSGGQRQRVALGRALVREPCAFLFDEPLSNLDAKLRVETRAELSRLHRRLGATMVYVTHDQVEAVTLGDRVAVLRDGVLQQVAPPMELYRAPANRFVGEFIGSPAMNFFEGTLRREGAGCVFRGRHFEMAVPRAEEGSEGAAVLGVRPHDLGLGGAAGEGDGVLRAEVGVVEPMGSEQVVHLFAPGGERVVAVTRPDLPLRVEETVEVRIPARAVHLFRGSDGRRIPAAG